MRAVELIMGGKQRKERYAKRMGMLYMVDSERTDRCEEGGGDGGGRRIRKQNRARVELNRSRGRGRTRVTAGHMPANP